MTAGGGCDRLPPAVLAVRSAAGHRREDAAGEDDGQGADIAAPRSAAGAHLSQTAGRGDGSLQLVGSADGGRDRRGEPIDHLPRRSGAPSRASAGARSARDVVHATSAEATVKTIDRGL